MLTGVKMGPHGRDLSINYIEEIQQFGHLLCRCLCGKYGNLALATLWAP
jgi:hypothetical protein